MSDNDGLNTEHLERIGRRAQVIAKDHKHEYVTCEHLLDAMLEDDEVQEILEGINADSDEIKAEIDKYYNEGHIPTTAASRPPRDTEYVKRVVQRAVASVMMAGKKVISGKDLLVSLIAEDNIAASFFLKEQDIGVDDIREYIQHSMDEDVEGGGAFASPGDKDEEGGKGKMTVKKATKILEKYCDNLNERAADHRIDPLIGREDEVFETVHIISRRTKNNGCLVGEPGVGKTAIVEGLAKLIVDKNVPKAIEDATVYSLNVTQLIAGTRYRGDFEERMNLVLKALEFLGNEENLKPILFIDEIHMIMGAGSGGSGAMDVANILKPALAKGHLRCIGSTTYEEWRKHFEKDRALMRRFQQIQVEEPSQEDTLRILEGLQEVYEKFHGVKFQREAVEQAVKLSVRYIHNRFLPDKAIDVMDAVGARVKIQPEEERNIVIGVDAIEFEVAKIAKIPVKSVSEDDAQKLSHLEYDLKLVVFGQETAIDAVTEAVIQSRAGLREPDKTLGSFLFAGPTGVGKTETAKKLSEVLGIPLVRFDMSEYQEKHTVAKLIGSPPGYVGYDDGAAGAGLLINELDKHPHCILLLDEVEKAHPDVYNILLGVMDNGLIKSGGGKEVSARNCYIIMTTNAGAADSEKAGIGFGAAEYQDDKQQEAIEKFFSPEFRNRLDEVVYFKKLEEEHIRQVVDKFMNELNFLLEDQDVVIKLDDKSRAWLAERGFDPKMGARPLARVIRDKIKRKLSRDMLFGDLKNGGEVKVSTKGEGDESELTFKITPKKVKKAESETAEA